MRSFHGVQINSDVTDVDGFGNVAPGFDLCKIRLSLRVTGSVS